MHMKPSTLKNAKFGTSMIRPRTLHPLHYLPVRFVPVLYNPVRYILTYLFPCTYYPEVAARFVPEKTHCHEKCVHFVPEFIDCANAWSLFFLKKL
jgi:hypothetical protein